MRPFGPAALLLVALALLLAACAPHGPILSDSGLIAGGVPVAPEHTLSPGDSFEIRFPFAAEYNDRVTVGADGTVAPQAIGSVAVGGLTLPEARQRLRQRYAKLLRDPELSITMRHYAPEVVFVDGWVNRPGVIRSDLPLTVARALAQAGGSKTGARLGEILVLRHDADGTVHAAKVALGPYAGAAGEDPLLKSFDVVYVPQTAIAAVSDFLKTYVYPIPFTANLQLPAPTAVTPPRVLTAPTQPVPAPAVR
jgi:protein involved in polysaccharide export with SLBB domain